MATCSLRPRSATGFAVTPAPVRVCLVIALAVTTIGCSGATVSAPTGHSWTTSLSANHPTVMEERHAMTVGNRARTWLLQEPADRADGERLPVVVILHGHGSTSDAMASYFADRAATRRFVAVYPQGWGDTWDVGGRCCFPSANESVDDFAFFDAILDDLASRPDVDPARISLAGGSLGGVMAYDYGCRRAYRLAGLVSYEGTRPFSCLPYAPLRTLQIHSLTDEAIPYDGGFSTTQWLLGLRFPAVVASVEQWAAANGDCPEGPTESEEPVSAIATASIWDCGGTVTRLDTLSWGPHAWPVVGDYVVVDHILDFLLQQAG